MEKRELVFEDENLTIDLILPKNEEKSLQNCTRSSSEKTFIYVNQRPIQDKKIEKLLKKTFMDKYPIGIVSITGMW